MTMKIKANDGSTSKCFYENRKVKWYGIKLQQHVYTYLGNES